MAYRGSWPLTVKGHSGSRVFALQYLLKYRGYSPGTVDGKFGTNTYNAARNFQRSRGLVVDGKVGTNTWSKLIATFRKGSSNNAVRAIQYLLRYRYGYTAVGNVDGIYGTKTYDCSKNFQSKAGISADGVVGQNTWRYLLGSDADTSVGKNYGGSSSSSSSSGGGSGGYSNGYAATAAGMADYAYSCVGKEKYALGITISDWCAAFVTHCAARVGYSPSGGISSLTPEYGGTQAHRDYYIAKGFTARINDVQYFTSGYGKHWGIIWSKTYTNITTIEGKSSYKSDQTRVQKVGYYWDTYTGTYRRDDRIGNNFIREFIKNY